MFLSDPGVPGPIFVSGCPPPLLDLTDVTLADEDTNSIQSDDANKANQGNVAMQVAQPGGQICNWCKKPYLLVRFATYVSGAT